MKAKLAHYGTERVFCFEVAVIDGIRRTFSSPSPGSDSIGWERPIDKRQLVVVSTDQMSAADLVLRYFETYDIFVQSIMCVRYPSGDVEVLVDMDSVNCQPPIEVVDAPTMTPNQKAL